MLNYQKAINEYINALREKEVHKQTEHSGRTFLENLLDTFTHCKDIKVTHEPLRDKEGRGAPDYKVDFEGLPLGYIENKKIGENLDKILKGDQISKYNTMTNNLILTDYLRWVWIYEGNIIKDIRLCEKTILDKKGLIKDSEVNGQSLVKLVEGFLSQKPEEIKDAFTLAHKLAKPTRTIREYIAQLVKEAEEEKTKNDLTNLYEEGFKKNISENTTIEQFADAFAQTLSYSLFLAKLNLKDNQIKFTLSNIADHTPKSFSLIKNIVKFIPDLGEFPALNPYINRILYLINQSETQSLKKSLEFSKGKDLDPYIYFYEDFLKEYDHKQKIDSGVYYTPPAVVRCIVNQLDSILKEDFLLHDGLAQPSLKILDFACGTGTFLFEIYKKILEPLSSGSYKKENLIQNHILEDVYGFELLIPAYCVSHVKLSQYLKEECNYSLGEKERIRVYLTNTLEEKEPHPAPFLDAIAEETRASYYIKTKEDILVVTGNPPYNVKSKNTLTGKLIDFHANYKPSDEKKLNLDDDYIKFMAFAHKKIKQTGQGAVGIIVNNSFLTGLTHRKMRNELRKDFEQIYILNLKGSGSSIKGIKDENVFDIKQEVCIVLLIKNEKLSQKGVFYKELIGSRGEKFKELESINRKDFEELQIDLFNKQFRSTAWGKNRFIDDLSFFYPIGEDLKPMLTYGEFWGITDIFEKYGSGVKTDRDDLVIDFDKAVLEERMKIAFSGEYDNEFEKTYNLTNSSSYDLLGKLKSQSFDSEAIKPINYRPFDTRFIYYKQGFTSRSAYEQMQHFLAGKNKGLVFMRGFTGTKFFNQIMITENIGDLNFYGYQSYITPLYLYPTQQQSFEGNQKISNLKPEFISFVGENFGEVNPEEVLAYIYAVLHSPNYRTDYLELLKIDFPRIPFNVTLEEFRRLSSLGQKLIKAHLMEQIPDNPFGEQSSEGEKSSQVEFVRYDEEKKRIYFNKTTFFENVCKEIWEFQIGGYKVLDKYLKARVTRDLRNEIEQVENIVKVLGFTIQTMKEIG